MLPAGKVAIKVGCLQALLPGPCLEGLPWRPPAPQYLPSVRCSAGVHHTLQSDLLQLHPVITHVYVFSHKDWIAGARNSPMQ
jgi:hypothetical protein